MKQTHNHHECVTGIIVPPKFNYIPLTATGTRYEPHADVMCNMTKIKNVVTSKRPFLLRAAYDILKSFSWTS